VGTPLIVTVFEAKDPDTPAGKPEKVAPVAPVVANIIAVIVSSTHNVRFWPAAIVFRVLTVMVPLAVAGGQPPVVVTV